MIEIKKLSEKNWKEFRELRLEALNTDPAAFGSSFEEEVLFSQKEWKKRIHDILFATFNNKPVGMIVYVFEEKLKIKHIANIYGVFVKKEFRGQKIGEQLIKNAISVISKRKDIIKIKLNVNPDQKSAVKLYEKYGFKITGKYSKELYVCGNFYDELIMEKFINNKIIT